jgi:leucyl-tRNA synthetase
MSSPNLRYHAREAEARWQSAWAERQVFDTQPASSKPDYFVLEMFPYPSGNIHMGHVRNYTLGDVTARFKRALGYNVLYPMGWDAFGLPAENAAIQRGIHPREWTLSNIATMREQLKSIGLSYDWSREVTTCLPDYYRHEQKFFLEFLKRGIAYRKEAVVNWDPVDHTVLANEQVIDGKGWRSGAPVERRTLSQWFLKITDYADELLTALGGLSGWPDKVRIMQEKWIGKSSGALVRLALVDSPSSPVASKDIEIYTTRPDTFYGMSFVAIAPEHPLVAHLAPGNADLAAFLQECSALGTSEEAIEKAEKKGFDTGLRVVNPFTGREHPLYIANFVLMGYGTGAVFGCPAHDQRDFEFASKYGLPILPVIAGTPAPQTEAFTDDGTLVNSPLFDGLNVVEAKEKAIAELERMGIGARKVNYRLRDWGVSRQRYWGCPIPIIHCDHCGVVPVPEAHLPVTLPDDVTFDKPGNPLDHHPTWKHVDCPSCGKPARRETDTFDTFFESSWYFAAYASGGQGRGITHEAARFLPVKQYIGGIEHAVLHLLYARFFTKALRDCGILPGVDEPFLGLMTQGMVGHASFKDAETGEWLYPAEVAKDEAGNWQTIDGGRAVVMGRSEKMSKSKKNTVDPRGIIDAYGADTARLFMMSDSPPERDLEWTEAGVDGAWRYLQRLYRLVAENTQALAYDTRPSDVGGDLVALRKHTHKTIDAVTKDIEAFHFNKAVARIRELTNALEKLDLTTDAAKAVFAEAVEAVLHLVAPFLPHLAEELWGMLGHADLIATRPWPKADPALLEDETVTVAVQVNGKLRATLALAKNLPNDEAEAAALAQPSVQGAIEGKSVKKVVVVPNRIVNIVAA